MKLVLALLCFVAYLGYRAPGPPDHLKINGQYWKVEYQEHLFEMTLLGPTPLAGLTECAERKILIAKDDDPADWRDTLLHEAAHAYVCGPDNEPHNDWYNSTAEGDHPGIEKIAEFGVNFIRENPEAVRWMQK